LFLFLFSDRRKPCRKCQSPQFIAPGLHDGRLKHKKEAQFPFSEMPPFIGGRQFVPAVRKKEKIYRGIIWRKKQDRVFARSLK